jgi:hypothetical protein
MYSYDGYAAQAGFRTGDIIIGIEMCEQANTTEADTAIDGTIIGTAIQRRMVQITPRTSDDEWAEVATSCEKLAPGEPVAMLVRRFEPITVDASTD